MPAVLSQLCVNLVVFCGDGISSVMGLRGAGSFLHHKVGNLSRRQVSSTFISFNTGIIIIVEIANTKSFVDDFVNRNHWNRLFPTEDGFYPNSDEAARRLQVHN